MLGIKRLFDSQTAALEISNSSIKLLELSKDSNSLINILSYAIEPLADNTIVDNEIKNEPELINSLKLAVKKAKLNSKNIICSLPESLIISKTIQLKNGLTDSEILEELELESEKYIPYPIEDTNLDFFVIGPSATSENFMDVQIIASKSMHITARVNAINKCGLTAKVIDSEIFAIERAFKEASKYIPDKGLQKLVAMIDIGYINFTITVFNNLKAIYSRTQDFGIKYLIEEVKKLYDISSIEAMQAVRFNSLPDSYIPDILKPFTENIVKQIDRALQLFFSTEENYNEIDYIMLAGGGASIINLEQKIKEILNKKAYISNPFVNMSLSSNINPNEFHNQASSLITCCGLALREYEDEN